MQQNNYVIHLENLTKKVRKTTILAPLSYKLAHGKILALCGGNGAGKSTLIRLLTGLMKPTSGTIAINGMERNKQRRDYFHAFGYMPDDFQFQPTLTARETITFYAKMKNIAPERTEAVIKQVGLTEHGAKKVAAFSKGMRQRLLLAQALLSAPSLLILDEPTNGLDPYWIEQFAFMMEQARANGQTVIFSTHDLLVAEQIADQVIFLHEGKVMSEGPIEKYAETGLQQTFAQLFFEKTNQSS